MKQIGKIKLVKPDLTIEEIQAISKQDSRDYIESFLGEKIQYVKSYRILPEILEKIKYWFDVNKRQNNLIINGFAGTGKTFALGYIMWKLGHTSFSYFTAKELAIECQRLINLQRNGSSFLETMTIESKFQESIIFIDDLNLLQCSEAQISSLANFIDEYSSRGNVVLVVATNMRGKQVTEHIERNLDSKRLWRRLLQGRKALNITVNSKRECKTCKADCNRRDESRKTVLNCADWKGSIK